MDKQKRPISPFLTIYRPQITSLFSILERITGVLLVLVLFVVYITLKMGETGLSFYGVYSLIYMLYKGGVGGFVINGLLVFILLNFYYHVLFGTRYLFWDKSGGLDETLFGIDMDQIYKSNILLVSVSAVLSIAHWLFILNY